MPEQFVIEHCAPTLAGIKTGNLFSIETAGREEAYAEVRELNNILKEKGVRAIPVSHKKHRTQIYLYRPDRLKKDLQDPEAAEILKQRGYRCDNPNLCVTRLIKALEQDGDYPHEIGLFLGYPPEDVKGFINSPCEGVQCCGYWKVYGDREKAEKTFASYRHCTESYRKAFSKGKSLAQLTVKAR